MNAEKFYPRNLEVVSQNPIDAQIQALGMRVHNTLEIRQGEYEGQLRIAEFTLGLDENQQLGLRKILDTYLSEAIV